MCGFHDSDGDDGDYFKISGVTNRIRVGPVMVKQVDDHDKDENINQDIKNLDYKIYIVR